MNRIIIILEDKIKDPKFRDDRLTHESYLERFQKAKKLADESSLKLPAAYEARESERARLYFLGVLGGASYGLKKGVDYLYFGEGKQGEITSKSDEKVIDEVVNNVIQVLTEEAKKEEKKAPGFSEEEITDEVKAREK